MTEPADVPAYPPAIFHGATGELSARVLRAEDPPDLVHPNGNEVRYLNSGASTGGLYGLYRWDFSEAVSGPDEHFHRTLTESFFILSGEVMVCDGRGWHAAHAGDYLYVPAGGIHGFRNESGEKASMLLHFAPGAPREGYFEGLARVAAGETMTDPERDAFMAAHDNLWVEG